MGVQFYPVLEQEIAGVDTLSVNGKALSRAQEQLDGLAKKLGHTGLMEFVSFLADEQRGLAEDSDIPLDEITVQAEQWLDAGAALDTVHAVLGYLTEKAHPLLSDEAVMEDLRALASVLGAARDAGVRFHMSIDT